MRNANLNQEIVEHPIFFTFAFSEIQESSGDDVIAHLAWQFSYRVENEKKRSRPFYIIDANDGKFPYFLVQVFGLVCYSNRGPQFNAHWR